MSLKGTIQSGHIPLNRYRLLFLGLPEITAISVGGLEEEIETAELPDRTRASDGQTGVGEFTISVPMHHLIEQAALEAWFAEGKGDVLPTYKKSGTMIYEAIDGQVTKSYTLLGVFPTKRATPDAEMSNEGDMANVEWTFSYDECLPV